MKKLRLIALGITICTFFFGCGKSSYDPNYYDQFDVDPNETYELSEYSSLEEYIEDNCDSEEVFEYLFDHYSNKEILEHLGGYDFLYELGLFDFEGFVEDLEYNGGDDGIRSLIRVFDKAGYYPNSVIGDYFADNNHVIHKTNSTCFDSVPIEEIEFLDKNLDLEKIEEEINSDDSSINGYTICPDCIDLAKESSR